ncbi:hypothetical protein GGD38_006319 [Chitinophagaceae bacterium OAS944]|nr:hypothetical protein [Chitinophagaceae bacterium OAS944]
MVNRVNLSKAHFAAKPPPITRLVEFEICTNHLLHEPYSKLKL